jgi:hypothetical protein
MVDLDFGAADAGADERRQAVPVAEVEVDVGEGDILGFRAAVVVRAVAERQVVSR